MEEKMNRKDLLITIFYFKFSNKKIIERNDIRSDYRIICLALNSN